MTKEYIKDLFSHGYNPTEWKKFLAETFIKSTFFSTSEILTGIDANIASQAKKLGFIKLDENGSERQISVYEVTLSKKIVLERNRVGLRNLLRKHWKDLDGAFITFHKPDDDKWRFTYVSELTGYDADGEFENIKTEPKRFTYLLGKDERTRTAEDRFFMLANKGKNISLSNIKDAFEVEKLSKTFFIEYKKHYDSFCSSMISKPGIKQTFFNGDDKAIRDFNKKLLGRIVFLYFIQKKGWLGVPLNSEWGTGDFNFMCKQFENFKYKNSFYQLFLSPLFFETLNLKRPNDIAPFLNNLDTQENSKNQSTDNFKIPYLNGGLFEEDDVKHRDLVFDSALFKNLFDFFDQYNFTIYEDDPNDHTVAVDPEMLGHIFENLLEDNKDKGAFYTPKEIVHYMCQESLIEYLCTASVNFNSTPDFTDNEKKSFLTDFIKKKEINASTIENLEKSNQSNKSKESWFRHLNDALDTVKICDPAIGSGAFPMGLLHEIFTAKQTLHYHQNQITNQENQITNQKNQTNQENHSSDIFDAPAVKLNIIQNSIYGVDIERGAVDIARLRFWLSLIVDEEKPKPLPNLDYKIVVGNSLVSKLGNDIIDIDWNLNATSHDLFGLDLAVKKGELLKKISAEQKEFFNPASDKKKLAADIRKLKIDLLVNQLQLMVKTTNQETVPSVAFYKDRKKFLQASEFYQQTVGWKNSIKDLEKLKAKPEQPLNFFDWKLDFPEIMNENIADKVGFDIVIGNPPYVRQEKIGLELKVILKQRFAAVANGTADLYVYFLNLGLELLKIKGVLSFITPNKWIQSNYGIELRKYLVQKDIKVLIDFGELNVFSEASTFPCIILISNYVTQTQQISYVEIMNLSDFSSNNFSFQNIQTSDLEAEKWILDTGDVSKIINKLENKFSRLGKIFNNSLYSGIKTGANEVLILDKAEVHEIIKNAPNEIFLYKKICFGKDFKKYQDEIINPKYIFYPYEFDGKMNKIIDINQYPATLEYLNKFKNKLSERAIIKDGIIKGTHKWYELQQINRFFDYSKAKIIYPDIAIENRFFYDENGLLPDMTCFFIPSDKKEYIGILNSTLFKFLASKYCPVLGNIKQGGRIRYKSTYLEKIPIPILDETNKKSFILKTKEIFSAKNKNKDTSALEQAIDNKVYKLYALTYEEVKIIDPLFGLSAAEYAAVG